MVASVRSMPAASSIGLTCLEKTAGATPRPLAGLIIARTRRGGCACCGWLVEVEEGAARREDCTAVTRAVASVGEGNLKGGVLRRWRTGAFDDGLRKGMYHIWTEEGSERDAPTTSREGTCF